MSGDRTQQSGSPPEGGESGGASEHVRATDEMVREMQREEKTRRLQDASDDKGDCVDEQAEETFPASDSPGNY